MGYVEGCAGDWYSYHQFDSSAQDVNKVGVFWVTLDAFKVHLASGVLLGSKFAAMLLE